MKFRKKSSKKADLSLSVNSIVILIIAITVLGLGLTFVRQVFLKGQARALEAVNMGDLTDKPTSEDPLKVTPGELELRTGKSSTIVENFMNGFGSTKYCKLIKYDITPTPSDSSVCKFPPSITLNQNCYKYMKDQIMQGKVGVEGKSLVVRETYTSSCSNKVTTGWPQSATSATMPADEGTWVLTLKVACFPDTDQGKNDCTTYKDAIQTPNIATDGLATKDLVVRITQ